LLKKGGFWERFYKYINSPEKRLPTSVIKQLDEDTDEIEKLKTRDQNLWRVFGEGQKGVPTRVVFNHQQIYSQLPPSSKLLGYGIDWGYNDPSTLVRVYKDNDSIYCEELLYLRNVTIPDFIYKIKDFTYFYTSCILLKYTRNI
jgi:hypothetical protein